MGRSLQTDPCSLIQKWKGSSTVAYQGCKNVSRERKGKLNQRERDFHSTP